VIDADAMAKALNGDGVIHVETADVKGVIEVIDGAMVSSLTLKRMVRKSDVERLFAEHPNA
jgi:hypothetical protein